jgi:hypothetical protein
MFRLRYVFGAAILTVLAMLTASAVLRTEAAPAPPKNPEELWLKARCDGRYRMLLQQIKVEKDAEKYGEFHDLGYRDRAEYAGHTNLPKGWWVYVAPNWYIWRETKKDRPKRSYGPEQLTGEPDVAMFGDSGLAWCPLTVGQQDEWLILEYDGPIVPVEVVVHENWNPGVLEKVTVFKMDGTEVEAWKGNDPTPANNVGGVSEIGLKIDFKVTRVKLYLGTKASGQWHEIDAVGLRDKDKKMHWAVAAEASSTWARQQPGAPDVDKEEITEDRIRRLEDEVLQLRKLVEELRKAKKE